VRSRQVVLYDTTLRDGAQAEDIAFSLEDKLRITARLDELGVHYIEGGWPGANPKDAAYFREAVKMPLKNARLTAFGATRRGKRKASQDDNLKALIASGTSTVTIFGKSWDLHVKDALRVSPRENLSMIKDTVAYLKQEVPEVFYDAEHFFDGFRSDREYALATLKAAVSGGADCIVLCDTNGGMLTLDLIKVLREVQKALPGQPLGIHVHNDSETAVANTIACRDLSRNWETCRHGSISPMLAIPPLRTREGCTSVPFCATP
jgi:2-isopropylmalate synthase